MTTGSAQPRRGARFISSRLAVITLFALVFLYAFHFPALNTVNRSHGQCLAGTEPSGSKSAKASDAADNKKKSDPRVTVYVTSWCPACSMTIKYLKKKDIPFTVKDIEKNPDYMKEMIKKSGSYRGVPVLDIDGKTYLGFHPSIIDNLEK